MDEQLSPTQLTFLLGSSVALLSVLLRKGRPTVQRRRRTFLPSHCTLDPRIAPEPVRESNTRPTRATKDVVRFFDEVSQQDGWLVGGKGANLGELVQSGFPVPSGFCVTKVAFDMHMRRKVAGISKTLSQYIEQDGELTAGAARSLVLDAPLDDDIVSSIKSAYQSLCAKTGSSKLLVAVRSSATAEDSAEASFAGQLETFLGVEGEEDVVQAVKECWASLYSDRVDSYRRMVGKGRGTNESSISVCVVVQQMLDADSAGVMFTANPFTQALDEIVITGNWGLGESVVADIATPDTWELAEGTDGVFRIKTESIAQKKKKVVLRKDRKHSEHHQGCSEIVDIVDPHEQTSPCLTHDHLQQLARLAKKVQSHYGNHPQDTEWGIKDGKVYLLQARPITTLSDEPPRTINEFDAPCRPDDWITTCNAAEMFPGAMTPLTMSTFGRMADQGVQRMQILIGCRSEIDYVNRVSVNYYGNFFLNMTNTLSPMVAGMVGAQMTKDNGEMSILGSLNQGESLERLVKLGGGPKFIVKRLLNGSRYARTMLTARHRIPVMKQRIVECQRDFSSLFSSATVPSSALIWDRIDSLMDAFDDQWTDGIITSSTSAAAMLFAMKLLTENGKDIWGTQPVAELAILLGEETDEGTAESAGAVEAIDRLRDLIAEADPDSATAFASSTPEEALAWLQSKAQFKRDFDTLIERHGHRCVREAEMREKDWLEDPLPLIRMLQSSVRAVLSRNSKSDVSAPATPAKTGITPETVLASKKHLNFITRRLLRAIIKVTRKSVHLRELGKSLQVKLNAVFKHAYRKLGLQLVKEGRLPEADLLYFLTHEEIGRLACSPLNDMDIHRMKTRAAQRKRLFTRQGQFKFPELSQGAPKPIERIQGKEGAAGEMFNGTPVSAGIARGPARVARTLEEAEHLKEGEILITPQTDVGWTPYFSVAAGLVTEIGGMLSHGAVVAREYSLPCVVGVTNACDIIKTGTIVELDGDCGKITVVSTE